MKFRKNVYMINCFIGMTIANRFENLALLTDLSSDGMSRTGVHLEGHRNFLILYQAHFSIIA